MLRSENWPLVWPLSALVLVAVLYACGGRGRHRRDAAFYAGLACVAIAVDSPVDTYADRLFWVHMAQHVLLTMVAPPLLLVGRPWPRLIRPVPLRARRPLARTVLVGPSLGRLRAWCAWLASPPAAFVLFNGVLLAWHVPVLFDLTLRSAPVHALEHGLFFSTALLFWRHLVPATRRPHLTEAQRAVSATGAILVSWVLAVVLGLASSPLYAHYASLAHRPGGISALADQQLAAGIMWVPASIPFTVVAFVAAFRWLGPAGDLRPRET